jgi:HAD superfamily hydrolase (TIGR01509 family)
MIEFNKVPSLENLALDNIKAVIFDMDGTLLNSEILHAKGLYELLAESKNNQISAEELIRSFVGVAEPDIYKKLLDLELIPEITFDEFIDLKNVQFKNILKNKDVSSRLLDKGLLSLIKDLKTKNMKLALVTASERGTTDLFMDELNISSLFDIILTRDDTEKSKPDPMPYLKSFELLNIEGCEALIFEDSETGLQSAINSGANVCKVSWYESF